MKRTLIDRLPGELPEEFLRFAQGARIYDSSSSPEARVYFIDRDGGYFLKVANSGCLALEAKMNAYFHSKGLGAEVLCYSVFEGRDVMLTAKVTGEDCTHEKYLSEPKRLCELIATELRRLHELDFRDCPIQNRNTSYLELAERNYRTGSYDSSHFPDSFGYASAADAHDALIKGIGNFKSEVLLHGDYCLPNIMLNDWRLSGFIDLGGAGVGDRHIDLFWGVWTLGFNLGTDAYGERFLDAYGRDKINTDMLKTIAAAEVFG